MSQATKKTEFPSKKTAKGTELPLLNLQGKPYMQVAHRLVWFREEHPDYIIQTEVAADQEKGRCLAKAVISRPVDGGSQVVSTGHKYETVDNFFDYIEKAETGAIGRALAMAGYGTQFEPSFDEANRIVDAPVMPGKKIEPVVTPKAETVTNGTEDNTQLIRKNIVSTVYALDAKKIMSKDEFSKQIKAKYNVATIKDLDDEQLSEVYETVTNKLNKGVENNATTN